MKWIAMAFGVAATFAVEVNDAVKQAAAPVECVIEVEPLPAGQGYVLAGPVECRKDLP